MKIGLYYHILQIGIVYEKGKKEGALWKISERKRLKEECNLWQNIIKCIKSEMSGTDESDLIFEEMSMLAEKYDIKNYKRIIDKKKELKECNDNVEYSSEDLERVNEILDKLLCDFNFELSKINGKSNAYRILEVMHNFPRIFHGKDILDGSDAISFEEAINYSIGCMTEAMKAKYIDNMLG